MVSISTVIDIKAAPESLKASRYDRDIAPLFTQAERDAFSRAYTYDGIVDGYFLSSDDEELLAEVGRAMVRIDYAGAVRHIYQVISAVTVVGVLDTPNPQMNGYTAFIPLDAMQDEMGMMLNGRVTELLIREKGASDTRIPGKSESAEVITAALKSELAKEGRTLPGELAVNTWEAYTQDFIAASAGDDISMRVMIIILFVLSFLGIANTMLLAILERTKEIGMMRAQGMTDGQLVFTYMAEAAMIGVFGSILGMILGCLLNYYMIKYGIDFTEMTEAMGGDVGYRINGIYRSAWNMPVVIFSGIAASVISALTAYLPTRKAVKMTITDSLRFD
jgi:ABC-type lipoprotein release transport system permease subunit